MLIEEVFHLKIVVEVHRFFFLDFYMYSLMFHMLIQNQINDSKKKNFFLLNKSLFIVQLIIEH